VPAGLKTLPHAGTATLRSVLTVAADVTPLLTPRTGVGVFVGELLPHLASRHDLRITGYAVTWRGRHRLADAVPDGVAIAGKPMPARPLHQIWMRGDFPPVDRWIGRHQVVWGTNYVVPPTRATPVVSIYDLTPLRFPELADRHTRTFPRLIERAVRRGAWVHTLSNFVRHEIIEHFRVEPERVWVVPGGVRTAPAQHQTRPPVLSPIGAAPYILSLGTVEPRKGLPTLVAAFDAIAPDLPQLHLVIAGADGWGADALRVAIQRSPHRDRILRLGWIDEAARPALLRHAAAFAYPSLYEGFGFPPLEAMTAGVPVVATRTGSLPEVCEDSAALVPVGDTDALAEAIGQILTDDAHRTDLVRRGHATAARYSWHAAAESFVAKLKEAAVRPAARTA
jgi:glycosyltransferase involved in cell wall biosynthesis